MINTDHTPYYLLGRLMVSWLENNKELDEKYPHGHLHEAARQYRLQDDVCKLYENYTGDKCPELEETNLIQNYYQRVLDYSQKRKDIIINALLKHESIQISLFEV